MATFMWLAQMNHGSAKKGCVERYNCSYTLFSSFVVAINAFFVLAGLLELSSEFIQPFVLGCDTKSPKIVQLSLTAMQRLIAQQAIHHVNLNYFVSMVYI